MNDLKTYLSDVLGIKINPVPLEEKEVQLLPLFLNKAYSFKKAELYNHSILLLQIRKNIEFTAGQLKKHSEIIESTYNRKVVYVFDFLEAYNRNRLINKGIGFVVPFKQMYFPFLLVHLTETKTIPKIKTERLLPAAQCLLFYHLLKENLSELNFKSIAQRLSYGQMTITRIAAQLKELSLCEVVGAKEKVIRFQENKKDLWNSILPYLINPVGKTVFAEFVKNDLLLANTSALSHFSNMAESNHVFYAIYKDAFEALRIAGTLSITKYPDTEYSIEVWKYDPLILTNDGKYIDTLSLFACFMESKEERINSELNVMLEKLW